MKSPARKRSITEKQLASARGELAGVEAFLNKLGEYTLLRGAAWVDSQKLHYNKRRDSLLQNIAALEKLQSSKPHAKRK